MLSEVRKSKNSYFVSPCSALDPFACVMAATKEKCFHDVQLERDSYHVLLNYVEYKLMSYSLKYASRKTNTLFRLALRRIPLLV